MLNIEMRSVYDFRDYKEYLREILQDASQGLKQVHLAKAMDCQPAYVSQVLNGDNQINLEQADGLNRFLKHAVGEARFFILLVEYQRAGTTSLKKFLLDQIKELKAAQIVSKSRAKGDVELSEEQKAVFYSSWYYSAIQVALTIGELTQPRAIADRLGIPISVVHKALQFLTRTGLAKQSRGRYRPGPTRIHLNHDSPLFLQHHQNWRQESIRWLAHHRSTDLRYTSALSISQEDFEKVRTQLGDFIESTKATIRKSPPEELVCLNIDFFAVGGEG